MLKKLIGVALVVVAVSVTTAAQDAKTVIANVSKAMGMDTVTSLTYSGTAADVNFLQTVNINGPWPTRPITGYMRAIDLGQMASRATGATNNPGLFGPPAVAGTFNQNINPNAANWNGQIEYWITPWGFLKGAAANTATVTAGKPFTVISWSPALKAPSGASYKINGYVNASNMIERVETWVEHDMLGDMHVDATYTDYKDFGGLKVPTKINQKRGGFTFFEVTVADAKSNPANITELLTAPGRGGGGAPGGPRAGGPPGGGPPAGGPPGGGAQAGGPPAGGPPGGGAPRAGGPGGPGGAGAAPAAPIKLAEGLYQIPGSYNALAVEFKDYVVVVEAGQPISRGQQILDEVKKLIPNKPIRYIVNSHPHSDHAGGLAPFVAEGAIIVTAQNNVKFFQTTFSAPRTLVGDSLAKNPKKPVVEGVAAKRVFEDGNQVLELHHITDSDPVAVHSDGILIAYLPKARLIFQADFSLPNAGAMANPYLMSLARNLQKLKLDFDQYLPVHNAAARQSKDDVIKATGITF